MDIRLATPEDETVVINLLYEFYLASPYPAEDWNAYHVRKLFREVVEGPKANGVVFLAIDGKNRPVGLLGALKTILPFSGQEVGMELAWYVNPEYRSTRAGLLLLKAFEFWCKEIAKVQVYQVSSLENLPDVERLYEKYGYKMTEKAYIKWQQ